MNILRMLKLLAVAFASLASVWAIFVVVVLMFFGSTIFYDILLPKESSMVFFWEIPQQIQKDVVAGYMRGLRLIAFPLIAAGLLWAGAYVIAELQWRNERMSL